MILKSAVFISILCLNIFYDHCVSAGIIDHETNKHKQSENKQNNKKDYDTEENYSTNNSFDYESFISKSEDETYDESGMSIFEDDNVPTVVSSEYKSSEYTEPQLDPMFDMFGTQFDGTNVDNSLPIFFEEPQNCFIVRNRAVTLKCRAAYVLKLNFKCSGSSQPPPSEYESHVDPHTGVHIEEVVATISRDLVDEYFGKLPFKCECHAWSSRGVAKSQPATVQVAYIKKQFLVSPSYLKVELGSPIELHCEAPNGIPTPKLAWYKNNVQISKDNAVITVEGNLHIGRASILDAGNYTCVAENIAGKRVSETATVSILDGSQLKRNNFQSASGHWSSWSEWSSCSFDCVQMRRRTCITSVIDGDSDDMLLTEGFRKSLCLGKEFQRAECRGGNCKISISDIDWSLYLGLTGVILVVVVLGATLIKITCKHRHSLFCRVAREGVQSECFHNADKKTIHYRSGVITNTISNYEYPFQAHRYLNSSPSTNSLSEHQYDVPDLTSTYTSPIDGLNSRNSYNTAETSTSTSGSTYNIAVEPPTLSILTKRICKLNSCKHILTTVGGFLDLYNDEVVMYIPDAALGRNLKQAISLSMLSDESSRLIISEFSTYLSPIIFCSPVGLIFQKPIVLKIPHCMVNPEEWRISVWHSECLIKEGNFQWQKLLEIGKETINTPIFAQVEEAAVYLMTEQLGQYLILGEPLNDDIACKKMRLIVFGQLTPLSETFSIRIYIVNDIPGYKDMCGYVEEQLGGSFLGESSSFVFQLNKWEFIIKIDPSGGWVPVNDSSIQKIPYQNMLYNNSLLHCEFCLHMPNSISTDLNLKIICLQGPNIMNSCTFVINRVAFETSNFIPRTNVEKKRTSIINKNGTHSTYFDTEIRLSRNFKQVICNCLDPPRTDGNDWRLLANMLKVDRYIAYFATKHSPSEQILNLWECKNKNSKAIVDLISVLKQMDRQDILDAVENISEPLWF